MNSAALFRKLADVPLGEKTSRFDYESIDPMSGRLAIAKMGSGKLLVFDARDQKLVAELDGFPKATGVLVVPELRKIYVSVPGAGVGASLSVALGMAGLSKGSGAISILDIASLKEIARLPGGVFPDGIAYAPRERRVFVSDEMGGALTVIDADSDKLVGRIDTKGEVGNVQYDPDHPPRLCAGPVAQRTGGDRSRAAWLWWPAIRCPARAIRMACASRRARPSAMSPATRMIACWWSISPAAR